VSDDYGLVLVALFAQTFYFKIPWIFCPRLCMKNDSQYIKYALNLCQTAYNEMLSLFKDVSIMTDFFFVLHFETTLLSDRSGLS